MVGLREGHYRIKSIRLQWLRNQSKVKALQSDLRSINSNLTTCLTAKTVSGQVRLQTFVHEVAQVADQISTDNLESNRAICTRLNLQNNHLNQLSEQILQLQTNDDYQQSSQARAEDIRGSLTSVNGQADNTDVSLENAVDVKTSLKSLDQFSRSCTCYCYPKRSIQITEVLSSLTGSMCISYSRGQIGPPCCQTLCRRNLPTALNLTYYFPSWLLTKVVSVFLSFDPAGSPSVSLQVPRIRPDTSKIFHLATAGDIGGMKTMFERGLASPNDVSYRFGYSVLHVSVIL